MRSPAHPLWSRSITMKSSRSWACQAARALTLRGWRAQKACWADLLRLPQPDGARELHVLHEPVARDVGVAEHALELLLAHVRAVRAHEVANVADGQDPTAVVGGRP